MVQHPAHKSRLTLPWEPVSSQEPHSPVLWCVLSRGHSSSLYMRWSNNHAPLPIPLCTHDCTDNRGRQIIQMHLQGAPGHHKWNSPISGSKKEVIRGRESAHRIFAIGPKFSQNTLLHDKNPGASDGKESAGNVGDLGSIPGLGRSRGEGNSFPLQYSCLENSMDRGDRQATVHGVTKRQTQLSDFHFHFLSFGHHLSLRCYNKLVQTEQLKHQTSISQFWEAWKIRDQGARRSNVWWWRHTSWFADGLLFLYPHMRDSRDRSKLSVSPLVRVLIPSWGLHSHDLTTTQRCLLHIPSSRCKLRVQQTKSERDTFNPQQLFVNNSTEKSCEGERYARVCTLFI